MGEGLTVRATTITNAEQRLIDDAKKIRGNLDNLATQLRPLYNDWEGDAQNAFDDSKRKWDTMMDDMVRMLEQASVSVRSAGEEYVRQDRASGQALSL